MPRYKMKVRYDGHNFHGFQRQPNLRTVQGVIELGLKKNDERPRSDDPWIREN